LIGALGSCVADLGTCAVVVGSFVGVGFGGCFGCSARFDHFGEYFDGSGICYFGVNYGGWIVDCDFAS